MNALAIAFVLCAESGDAPFRVLSIQDGVLTLEDGRVVAVDGGVWLADDIAIARAKDLQRLAAENATLKTAPPTTSGSLVVALVVGITLGVALGLTVAVAACTGTGLCH